LQRVAALGRDAVDEVVLVVAIVAGGADRVGLAAGTAQAVDRRLRAMLASQVMGPLTAASKRAAERQTLTNTSCSTSSAIARSRCTFSTLPSRKPLVAWYSSAKAWRSPSAMRDISAASRRLRSREISEEGMAANGGVCPWLRSERRSGCRDAVAAGPVM
jgi:hypothetical protein